MILERLLEVIYEDRMIDVVGASSERWITATDHVVPHVAAHNLRIRRACIAMLQRREMLDMVQVEL